MTTYTIAPTVRDQLATWLTGYQAAEHAAKTARATRPLIERIAPVKSIETPGVKPVPVRPVPKRGNQPGREHSPKVAARRAKEKNRRECQRQQRRRGR